MSKARPWTPLQTILITAFCGLGHVASSVVIGAIGIILGIGISKMEGIESVRGNWAAWAFLVFGIGYLLWAIWRIKSKKPHVHTHEHGSIVHNHEHFHEHAAVDTPVVPHTHGHEKQKTNLTPWILFLIFVLGPCEPLIPVLMYPAAQASIKGLIAVAVVFALSTILTMVGVVVAVNYSVSFIKVGKLEKYTHAIAGATVTLSGGLILLGL
jgi:ABC-type nickel/cobalt efflux system permease component RcnA